MYFGLIFPLINSNNILLYYEDVNYWYIEQG